MKRATIILQILLWSVILNAQNEKHDIKLFNEKVNYEQSLSKSREKIRLKYLKERDRKKQSQNKFISQNNNNRGVGSIGNINNNLIQTPKSLEKQLSYASVSKTINCTAGNLSSLLTATELSTVTDLTIMGTIDARDFITMRDNMPVLAVLDISSVSIAKYTETYHTYSVNAIPDYAFYNINTNVSKLSLTTIKLPTSITTIGQYAFNNCNGLKRSLTLPSSVTTIGDVAFRYCSGFNGSLIIPSSVTSIGVEAFYDCSGFSGNLIIGSSVNNIGENAFRNCSGFIGDLIIPSSVTNIGSGAFYNCSNFAGRLDIPTSLTSIGNHAFAFCSKVNSIYSYSNTPSDLTDSQNAFMGVDNTKCILYVPIGTKSVYQAAVVWKNFTNITETSSINTSASNVNISADANSTTTITVTTSSTWSASSNQPWLTVSPSSGTGNSTITLTAEANNTTAERTAIITISAAGLFNQIITVKQAGKTNGIEDLSNNSISIYPNPVTYNFAINGYDGIATIKIFNIKGELKMTCAIEANKFISIESLPKGLYIIMIKTSKDNINRKLIVE